MRIKGEPEGQLEGLLVGRGRGGEGRGGKVGGTGPLDVTEAQRRALTVLAHTGFWKALAAPWRWTGGG